MLGSPLKTHEEIALFKQLSKIFSALSAVVVVSSPVFAASHTKDSDELVKTKIADQSAVLVDVREPNEWQAGHLRDAINVPLSDLKAGKTDALPTGKTIYLHCQSGRRVLVAADLLKDTKFTDVRPMAAGYPELLKKGFPPAP